MESISSITIPSDAVDITGASENVVKEIKLSDYVGAGISVVSRNTVTITVKIVKNSERVISYNTDNIAINNLKEGMTADIQTSSLSLKFTGTEENLSLVQEKNIVAEIDLSGLGVGEHMVLVKFTDIEGISIDGSYKVRVVIKAPEPETEEESSTIESTE